MMPGEKMIWLGFEGHADVVGIDFWHKNVRGMLAFP